MLPGWKDEIEGEYLELLRKNQIEAAASLLLAHKIGGLPVLDGERLVGIITEADLLRALLECLQGKGEEIRVCAASAGSLAS